MSNIFYFPTNLGAVKSYFFIGNIDNEGNVSYSKKQEYDLACFTNLFFASIVPGKNIRMDMWTVDDPYIFIDQKFFDVRDIGTFYSIRNKPLNEINLENISYEKRNIIQERKNNENKPINLDYNVKKLTSDGSLVIYSNFMSYWWGTNQKDNGEIKNVLRDDFLKIVYNLSEVHDNIQSEANSKSVIKKSGQDYQFPEYSKYGKLYELRDIEVDKSIAVFQRDKWINWRDGLVFENMNDLLPEGVLQVSLLRECLSSYKFKDLCFGEEGEKTLEELLEETQVNYKLKKVDVNITKKNCNCDLNVRFYYKNNSDQNVYFDLLFQKDSFNEFLSKNITDGKVTNKLIFTIQVTTNGISCPSSIPVSLHGTTKNSYVYKFNFCDETHYITVYYERV
ncbi:MAG: hypothetical protein NZZ41_01135 [Candidatus Dojkabacteria bacterium]|nr:hypothetical protein [Candidatus Dojkabacteria bacterium]